MKEEPSMRKAIIGVAVISAVVGLGIVGRRIGHKMREHCGQMAAEFRGQGEAAGTRQQTDHEAPQFVGQGEAARAA